MTAVKQMEQESHEVATVKPVTPMEMISQAVANGQGVDMVEKLMALQERWEANQGRKAFDRAISDAKAEIPVITKNRKSHNGKYADFAAYATVIDPILSRHGLSYTFKTKQDPLIEVTCVLSHRDGFSRENSLRAAEDKSGSKNAIQAIASTLSYLQRYTLVLALGLAASENDDDGQAAGAGEPITKEQFKILQGLIDDTNTDIQTFCNHFKVAAVTDMPASKFDTAVQLLKQKRSKANG